jgi:hypothetical protein
MTKATPPAGMAFWNNKLFFATLRSLARLCIVERKESGQSVKN